MSLQQAPPAREWMRPMLRKRDEQASRLLASILEEELDNTIINFMRLSRNDFDYLLKQIGPKIQRMDTNIRLTQAIGQFVPQVCDCLVEVLREQVKLPTCSDEWKRIAQGFQDKWNFPHAIGAIDGKHVMIKSPPHSGTDYFNYRRHFSIVLLGVVDANCNFMYADIGAKGRISDGGVFKNSMLHKKLERNELGIPSPAPLYQTSRILVPYMLLGDKAFPLTKYCLRPFSGFTERGSVERNFNLRHSTARRSVEMAFGILCGRFRVLRKPIELRQENAKK
uniref:DDE Tnp4 domain-containing protein n=1 Tax=Anopheles arabiensis TaxID=7173 RepID=A0A182IEP8_ANOAR